jgi:predicted RNA-binding Zn-ribbon protein involved in translation (DUF1610 family)
MSIINEGLHAFGIMRKKITLKLDSSMCYECHVPLLVIENEGIAVCPNCGNEKLVTIFSDQMDYTTSSYVYPYERLEYFKKKLLSFEEKIHFKIPQETEKSFYVIFQDFENWYLNQKKGSVPRICYNYLLYEMVATHQELKVYLPILKIITTKGKLLKQTIMWKTFLDENKMI